jgi:hypothetical protein
MNIIFALTDRCKVHSDYAAKRLVHNGFIEVNNQVVRDIDYQLPGGPNEIKVGKVRVYTILIQK